MADYPGFNVQLINNTTPQIWFNPDADASSGWYCVGSNQLWDYMLTKKAKITCMDTWFEKIFGGFYAEKLAYWKSVSVPPEYDFMPYGGYVPPDTPPVPPIGGTGSTTNYLTYIIPILAIGAIAIFATMGAKK